MAQAESTTENLKVKYDKRIDSSSDVIVVDASKTLTIKILRLTKDVQQQHGLRHGDYQRYRGYCTRRIGRLRKVLKLPQGDKKHYKKKDVLLTHLSGSSADERYLHIPLFLAERAWSYGMQLRQEANTDRRKKFHLINKLRKACVYSLQFQELCNAAPLCDARTKLEAEAYVAWMHGTLHFELSMWKSAAENLKKAQVVYENLLQALPDEEQSIYKAKVDELTPSLRYCAYNIGDGTSMNDLIEMRAQGLLSNIDSLISQTKSQSNESLQTTEWRGRKVTVRPEKVRLFLLSIQDLDKSIEKAKSHQSKIELIENMLIDCKDAISAVKDEIKQDPKLRQSDPNSPTTGIQYMLSYLSYIRLIRTLERNIYMVAQAEQSLEKTGEKRDTDAKKIRPQDLTRLYEIISQNVSELKQISGMENDVDYQKEIEVLSLSFKAFRCYYIAETLVILKRWKEAVALYSRSTNYATEALKSKPKQFNLIDELEQLLRKIEGCKYCAHAYSVLEDGTSEESVLFGKTTKSTKPLYERLSEYREDPQLNTKNPNVFKLTPDMQPIPCKPLFYDLAFNFVEFPSLMEKLDTGSAKKGAGISGFVKGFLGWNSGNK